MEGWGPKSSQWGTLFGLAALSVALLREPHKSPDDAAIIPLRDELKSYREFQVFYDVVFSKHKSLLSFPLLVTSAPPILLGQKFSNLVQYGLLRFRVSRWWNDSSTLLLASALWLSELQLASLFGRHLLPEPQFLQALALFSGCF